MLKKLILASLLFSSSSFSCGLHQNTGFNLTTEPGSLSVFSNIIDARQSGVLGDTDKPDAFRLFTIKAALAKPHKNKIDFIMFEAIKGHYSNVWVSHGVLMNGVQTLPDTKDLLVITELDVFDALALGTVSWEQAQNQGLVKVTGDDEKVAALNKWFLAIF